MNRKQRTAETWPALLPPKLQLLPLTASSMRLLCLPLGLLSLLVVAASASTTQQQETYEETLRLQSLPDGKVHSNFEFILRGPWLESGTPTGPNAVGTSSRRPPSPQRSLSRNSTPPHPPPTSPHLAPPPLPYHLILPHPLLGPLGLLLASPPYRRRTDPFNSGIWDRAHGVVGAA